MFILLLAFSLAQYPDYQNCDLFSNEEIACLNSEESCGFCSLTGLCIDWDICNNSPAKDNLNNEKICGNITESFPYGSWVYSDSGKTCKEVEKNTFIAEIFFLVIGGFFIILLLLFLIIKLTNVIGGTVKRIRTVEYTTML